MKKRIYIAPAQTVVEMDAKDAMMQVITTSVVRSDSPTDDVVDEADILSTEETSIGWHSTIWDED